MAHEGSISPGKAPHTGLTTSAISCEYPFHVTQLCYPLAMQCFVMQGFRYFEYTSVPQGGLQIAIRLCRRTPLLLSIPCSSVLGDWPINPQTECMDVDHGDHILVYFIGGTCVTSVGKTAKTI